jgi:hypothetical protein
MITSNINYARWSMLIGCLILVLWSANPSKLYFANDDFFHVPESGRQIFGQTYLLRPVSELTLWIDYSIWQKNAAGFHVTNLLLHLINTLLVYFFVSALLRKLGSFNASSEMAIAWFTMLLFLINPSSIEAVCWVLGRGASLSCCFILICLICFLQRDRQVWKGPLSLLFFFLSLLSYESGFIVPAIITVLAYAESRKYKTVFSFFTVILFWAILVSYLIVRIRITGTFLAEYEAGNILRGHWVKLFYNFNTLIARSLLPPMASGRIFLLTYIVFLAAALLVFLVMRKNIRQVNRLNMVLLLLFLITLLPVISLGMDTHDTEGGRFLYLPAVFVTFLMAVTIVSLTQNKPLFLWIVSLLMIFYFGTSFIAFSKHYQVSALIARSTLDALQDKAEYDNVYVIDLPSQYKGATIFRTGFDNALKWICPGLRYHSLQILGQKEIIDPGNNFGVKQFSFADWALQHPGWTNDQRNGEKAANLSEYPGAILHPGKDLLLIWTDSTFTKVRN